MAASPSSKPLPSHVSLKGIGTFGAGPRKARVLYAKIAQGADHIQELANLIVRELRNAKLVQAS